MNPQFIRPGAQVWPYTWILKISNVKRTKRKTGEVGAGSNQGSPLMRYTAVATLVHCPNVTLGEPLYWGQQQGHQGTSASWRRLPLAGQEETAAECRERCHGLPKAEGPPQGCGAARQQRSSCSPEQRLPPIPRCRRLLLLLASEDARFPSSPLRRRGVPAAAAAAAAKRRFSLPSRFCSGRQRASLPSCPRPPGEAASFLRPQRV